MLTTILDLVGSLLIILGLALYVATWTIPGAIATAGVGVLALSLIITRTSKDTTA